MFIFMTYNQALMWDRFERILVICAALAFVVLFESLTPNPIWIFTSLGTIAAHLLVLKCWMDVIRMARPHENCWAFKG